MLVSSQLVIDCLEATGYVLLVLAVMHVGFARYFKWAEELPRLSLINAQMMRVHTGFVALTVAGIGLLSITSAHELVYTPLGRRVSLGVAVFWGIRLLVQFVGYSSTLWRGKPFETSVHIVFTLFWVWLTALYSAVWWWNGQG